MLCWTPMWVSCSVKTKKGERSQVCGRFSFSFDAVNEYQQDLKMFLHLKALQLRYVSFCGEFLNS